MPEAVFLPDDGRFVATELARGPWDPNAQHGGAAAALLIGRSSGCRAPAGLPIARVTYELLRPVPLGELEVRGRGGPTRPPGAAARGLDSHARRAPRLVRARALRVRAAPESVPRTELEPRPPDPSGGRENDFRARPSPACSLPTRSRSGSSPGPFTAADRRPPGFACGSRSSTARSLPRSSGSRPPADFGNGISSPLSWEEYLFINPDLTLYVEREPVGEWIGLAATTTIAAGGIGLSESVLYDERGRIGRATQALLIARR